MIEQFLSIPIISCQTCFTCIHIQRFCPFYLSYTWYYQWSIFWNQWL